MMKCVLCGRPLREGEQVMPVASVQRGEVRTDPDAWVHLGHFEV